ncbi:hypothetical protein SteCoe_4068 [Stentor coeruleus]|uniref:Heat shock factor binding protein 1 n=1 Tax=Stentor coeruleus TaxID=5963 RepID=A0A1R2CVI3_9CILI|nr:hypothetical protein SteCoe_4068 [Stentor coeruleus]
MADEERPAQQAEDLTVFVQNLLNQMQTRFQQMSDAILGRIDEMGNRIDELEQSISELMEDAAIDEQRSPMEGGRKP